MPVRYGVSDNIKKRFIREGVCIANQYIKLSIINSKAVYQMLFISGLTCC